MKAVISTAGFGTGVLPETKAQLKGNVVGLWQARNQYDCLGCGFLNVGFEYN